MMDPLGELLRDAAADLFELWITTCLDGSTFQEWLDHKRGPHPAAAGASIRMPPRATFVELDVLAKHVYVTTGLGSIPL